MFGDQAVGKFAASAVSQHHYIIITNLHRCYFLAAGESAGFGFGE